MKIIISLSLCLSLLTILTACGNDAKARDSSELLQHMKFHDTEFSFPCTYGEISGQFGLANESSNEISGYSYTYYDLTYQENPVATIGFVGGEADESENREIIMLVIEDEQLSARELGETICNADRKTLIKALGKPDYQMEQNQSTIITYNWENVDLSIIFHDDQPHQYTFVKR